MTVGNIQTRHLTELLGDQCDISIVGHAPELMAEAVNRCNEIIFRFGGSIAHQQFVEHRIVRIGKENGFDIGIVDTHMLHAVFFLIAARQLMLLDDTFRIVVAMGTYHKTVLRFSVHCLSIDVVLLLIVLHQPAFILEHLEVFGSLFIDTRIIFAGSFREVDFRLDNAIETHLIVACLSASFVGVKHIVWTTLHTLNIFFRRANTLEWFNFHLH